MKDKLYTTNDGITVIYSPVKNITGVQFELSFAAGALNDPAGKAGLAHFCEHILMGCGTKRFTREEKNKQMGKYQYINAFTSNYVLRMVISATNDDIAEAVDTMTESFDGLNLTQQEFDTEKKIIKDEIITRKRTNDMLANMMIFKNLDKTPEFNNLEYSAAGSIDTLDNITLQDVKDYLRDFITKENLVITIAGNISKRQVDDIIKRYISARLPSSGKKGFTRAQRLGYKPPQYLHAESVEKGQAFINIFYMPSNNKSAQYIDRRKSVRNSIISGTVNELAFLYFREKHNLCYNVYLGMYQDSTANDLLDLFIECQDGNIEEVIAVYTQFISELLDKFDIQSFEKAKKRVLSYANFDVKPIKKITQDKFTEYNNYGNVLSAMLGDRELEFKKELISSITFDEAKAALSRIKDALPYVIIISDNDRFANFDYQKFIKKHKKS